MSYTRTEIVSGLFVIAAAVLFALFAFKAMPVSPLGQYRGGVVRCRTVLPDTTGIAAGAPVAVAGHEVGQVTGVELIEQAVSGEGSDDEGLPDGATRHMARVHFIIEDQELRLDPGTASVRIASSGLLGQSFLALNPGHWQQEPPPPVARIETQPVEIAGHSTPGLMEAMGELKPLAARLKRIARKLDERVLADQNLKAISGTLTDLRAATGRVRQIMSEDGSLDRKVLNPLSDLLATASESIGKLRQRLLEKTLPGAERLMADGSAAAKRARKMLDANAPRIKKLLKRAASTARTAEQRLASVADDAESLLQQSDAILTENRAEIAETIRRARRALWQAEMGMRKIRANPAVLFFGDEGNLLGASPYDAGWLRDSGRAEPYEQRDENE